MEEDKLASPPGQEVQVAVQESVRVSRRLEIKRETRKKKGKLVKIKLKQVIIYFVDLKLRNSLLSR